jgi:hypothetical protein
MGALETLFVNGGYTEKLAHRGETFRQIFRYLDAAPSGWIVETGTARIEGNWAGDGQSTLLWDRVAETRPDLAVQSIDLDRKAVETAMHQTKHVQFTCGDSVQALGRFPEPEKIRLLYLDSFDWQPDPTVNLDSAFHHMAELAAVWANLPSGCLVVVDDRHGEGWGKHFMVEFFMEKLGIEPLFKAYQIGWVKP